MVRANLFTTVSPTKLNEAHFSYSRELRPRSAIPSNVPADTAMGFATTFRFGFPFFLEPNVDELLWRTHLKDNFSIIKGDHNIKFGGEWLHTLNDQVFRGFFTGPLHLRQRFGLSALRISARCKWFWTKHGVVLRTVLFVTARRTCQTCGAGSTVGGPLLLYLQNGIPTGSGCPPPGIKHQE